LRENPVDPHLQILRRGRNDRFGSLWLRRPRDDVLRRVDEHEIGLMHLDERGVLDTVGAKHVMDATYV